VLKFDENFKIIFEFPENKRKKIVFLPLIFGRNGFNAVSQYFTALPGGIWDSVFTKK
jgi:hypothetical protein